MYSFLTTGLVFIFVLGVMILVHEFGHYAAAKLLGVRVEQFAVGFGKRLIGFRRGDTDYRINLLPLGGYVKMSGENPMDNRSGDSGEFMSHPRWHRFLIAIAGPAMNILLAIGLLTGIFMARYPYFAYLDQPAVIGWIQESSPAAKAGLQPGDRIVRIDGVQNPTWEDVFPKVALSPGHPVNLVVQRGSEVLEKTVVPAKTGLEQYGDAGWLEYNPKAINELEPGLPAKQAGLQLGDTIVAANGTPVDSIIPDLANFLQQNGARSLDLTVNRAGKDLTFSMTPAFDSAAKRYRIGLTSNPMKVISLPFGKALAKSLDENKKNSFLILELVEKMIQRKVSMKQIEGPIGIARISGQAARQKGWIPLLAIMAAISLNLGIFNLFPIPILDGGVILFLAIESVMRRDISLKIKERIYQAAFVFLLLFAVVVIYNDVVKSLPGVTQRLLP